jgi:AraC family transcriptional regulator of adaptative response/methylated-DNA-[protein]-cysteine methyltransferase
VQFEPADAKFKRWIAQVIYYLDQPQGVPALPLDVPWTVFQHRVW